MRRLQIGAILILAVSTANAEETVHTPYAGQETREIAALSSGDIEQIATGQGWGLALPAELNGVPGPTHLIELAGEIGLNAGQLARLTDLRDAMRAEAIEAGGHFIAAERALDAAFAAGVPDPELLEALVTDAGMARIRLRHVHLSAHLETVRILTVDQIGTYNQLRGYVQEDPCLAVPEGHDVALWRQHNGCS